MVGTGVAREMCLTGRSYDAQEALQIGFVNRVLAPADLLEAARTLAIDLATLPADMPESSKRAFVAHQPRLFES